MIVVSPLLGRRQTSSPPSRQADSNARPPSPPLPPPQKSEVTCGNHYPKQKREGFCNKQYECRGVRGGMEWAYSFIACLTGLYQRPRIPFEADGAGGGVTHAMHVRSRMALEPCIPTMPGQSTSGFHRTARALLAPKGGGEVWAI